MSTLINCLNKILNWLQSEHPDSAASLQPGLSIEEIEEKVEFLPFHLPKVCNI